MTDANFDASRCVAQVLSGDDGAFRELVDATYPLVARIVRSHLSPAQDRAACEQETYLRVFERLDQYRSDAPLEHWIARIAVNACLDALRKTKRRRELRWADLSETESAAVVASLADSTNAAGPEATAAKELVDHVLAGLDAEDAVLIRLHDLDERTLNDTATTLGWSLSWTKWKLARARGRVRETLERLLGDRKQ